MPALHLDQWPTLPVCPGLVFDVLLLLDVDYLLIEQLPNRLVCAIGVGVIEFLPVLDDFLEIWKGKFRDLFHPCVLAVPIAGSCAEVEHDSIPSMSEVYVTVYSVDFEDGHGH